MQEETKERYVNPFTDFGFKKIFGEEPSKELLIDFLNQLLQPEHKINNLTYGKLEKSGDIFIERKAVFDLYCENEKGEKFIVELQKAKQDFFKDRSIFYSTFPIREQAEKGAEWDFELKAVYTIGILNFIFDDENKDKTIISEVKLMDTKKKTVFFDKLTYIYIQIPNFKKKEHELKTRFDKWLYILKNLHRFQDRPQILKDRIFDRLFQIAEISNFNQDEYKKYTESKKVYMDLNAVIKTAKNEGEKIGIKKGEKIGVKKGEKTGVKKGFYKGIKERDKIVYRLHAKGKKIDEISELTGLRIIEIEKILKIIDKNKK